ncbi:MAG: hypothetical protein H0T47_09685 [Planctomycetaceae bacterium]|nr:hypothetical protein [Planctomycetaceae bacterium]
MSRDKKAQSTTSTFDVPFWLAAMILSPMIGVAMSLYLGERSQSQPVASFLAGVVFAVIGSGAAAAFAHDKRFRRTFKASLGAGFGLLVFGMVFVAAAALSIILK